MEVSLSSAHNDSCSRKMTRGARSLKQVYHFHPCLKKHIDLCNPALNVLARMKSQRTFHVPSGISKRARGQELFAFIDVGNFNADGDMTTIHRQKALLLEEDTNSCICGEGDTLLCHLFIRHFVEKVRTRTKFNVHRGFLETRESPRSMKQTVI